MLVPFYIKFCVIACVFLQTPEYTRAENNDIGRFFTSTNGANPFFPINSGTPSPPSNPSNVPATRNAVPTFTGLASNLLLNAVLGNQQQQSNPIIDQYATCPVDVPFCFRTRCNAYNPRAESQSNECFTDPTCCFDQELYQYKKLYGATYLRAVPVCYHGPTSTGFRQMAKSAFPAAQQWNPFLQSFVVTLLERTINSSGYLNVAFSQCSISNLISVQGPICGWRGIKRGECRLRGCCYDDGRETCHYPRNFGSQVRIGDSSYPELVAQTFEETQCSNAPVHSRLPCMLDDVENATVANKIAKCHFLGCCVDISYIVPNSILSTTRSAQPIPSQLQPEFGTSTFRTGSALTTILNLFRSSGTQQAALINAPPLPNLNCPYFSVTMPGMPDLSRKTHGCCERVWCYQAKRLQDPTIVTTPPTAQQINPGRPLGNLDPLDFYTPFSTSGPTQAAHQPQGTVPNPFTLPSSRPDEEGANLNPDYPELPLELLAFVQQRNGSDPFPLLIPGTPPPMTQTEPEVATLPTPPEYSAPTNDVWGPWGNWGECQVSCGNGVRTRERSCYVDSSLRRVYSSHEPCEGRRVDLETCTGSCSRAWGRWDEWGSCSRECGKGIQKRKRKCLYKYTTLDDFLCDGKGSEERSCEGDVCAHWGHWSAYGGCRAECGTPGNQILHRVCLDNENPVEPHRCRGKSSKLQSCLRKDCVFLTEWGRWEECSHTCGTGVQTRRKLCIENGLKADPSVCNGTWLDTRTCKRGLCPGMTSVTWATWEQWGSWGDCSSTCGSGSRMRMRECVFRGTSKVSLPVEVCQDMFKGQPGLRSSSCSNRPCSESAGEFYAWMGWTEYSDCSRSCGIGVKTRRRYCFGESGLTDDNERCSGNHVETKPCGSESDSCTTWTTLSDWTSCRVTCGEGTRIRLRCRTNVGSIDCINNTIVYDRAQCLEANCP